MFDLPKLRILNLSYNKLKNIKSHYFNLASSIEKLNLNNNLIDDIETLSGLRSLIILDLSNNKIQYLNKNNFIGMSRFLGVSPLQFLNLSNNDILGWDAKDTSKMFKDFKNLELIDLSGNDNMYDRFPKEHMGVKNSVTVIHPW